MNEKLKELYYRDDIIIGSKQNFIACRIWDRADIARN